MERMIERIAGDASGTSHSLEVLRFRGRGEGAPSAYLQAALHAGELPGVVALHRLVPMLEEAEREGRVAGAITIVPQANPIGAGQVLFGDLQGRFGLGSRVNFNRDFPLLASRDPAALPCEEAPVAAEVRLKARLLGLALAHDLILDLHCDDESLPYIYVPGPFWPHLSDLAAALGAEAAIVWDDGSDGAFEEAAAAPALAARPGAVDFSRLAATTVELRGIRDVSDVQARSDAEGLYRFLVWRGVVEDGGMAGPPAFGGLTAPIDHVEVVRAPVAGPILFHVQPGDRVEEGVILATILGRPGDPTAEVAVRAPQSGLVLTRRSHRSARRGDDLVKIVGARRSAAARPGTLEA